jgi:glycosyltransferase involved in cell wall biosynthesis
MKTITPILSFLVVSYNQVNYIKRCIDSLLSLPLDITYEIVIGDDRSNDGTYEILLEYQNKNPEIIRTYRINSDDINPKTVGERAGYNRRCGYKLLRGKYYAEIDGDDYVLPNKVYQKQVELLEQNEDCSLCMQNILRLNNGDTINDGVLYHPNLPWESNQIITSEEYLSKPEFFMQHQGFVFRKNEYLDAADYIGRFYEDTTVSLFHLQFGKLGIVNESGYVWINYPNGINGSLRNDDREIIINLLPFLHIVLFPILRNEILRGEYNSINHFVKRLLTYKFQISDKTIIYLESINIPIYKNIVHICTKGTNTFLKCKLFLIRILLILVRRFHSISLLKIANRILIGKTKHSDIV